MRRKILISTQVETATQVMLMGIIVMAFLIGDLSNIMSNLDPVANEFKQTLDLNDYMHRSGFDK